MVNCSASVSVVGTARQLGTGCGVEADYARYTHGSDANAHLKPLACDYAARTSAPAPPRRMLHGYGVPADRPLRPHAPAERRPDGWHQAAPPPAEVNYRAFDHSARNQPLTASMLSLHTAPHTLHRKSRQRPDASAPPAKARKDKAPPAHRPANNSSSANNHPPPPAPRSHNAPAPAKHHRQKPKPRPRPDPPVIPAIAASTLENDMAMAGFINMHSMYNANKTNKNHPELSPPRRTQAPHPPFPMPLPMYQSAPDLPRPQRPHAIQQQWSMPNLPHGSAKPATKPKKHVHFAL